MATYQLVQAVCKAEWVKQRCLVEGPSATVCVLFIPAGVAEGGVLSQGLFMAVILRGKYPV